MNVKTTKWGQALVIPIPASFEIPENAEYTPIMGETGIISFIPVHQNLFKKDPSYDVKAAMDEMGIGDHGQFIGKENVW